MRKRFGIVAIVAIVAVLVVSGVAVVVVATEAEEGSVIEAAAAAELAAVVAKAALVVRVGLEFAERSAMVLQIGCTQLLYICCKQCARSIRKAESFKLGCPLPSTLPSLHRPSLLPPSLSCLPAPSTEVRRSSSRPPPVYSWRRGPVRWNGARP